MHVIDGKEKNNKKVHIPKGIVIIADKSLLGMKSTP